MSAFGQAEVWPFDNTAISLIPQTVTCSGACIVLHLYLAKILFQLPRVDDDVILSLFCGTELGTRNKLHDIKR